MKKLFYLFLALLLPGLLFIFLKYFGKNQFDIPVYYTEGVRNAPTDCDRSYPIPYFVPGTLLKEIGWKGNAVTLLVSHEDELRNSLTRIREEFTPDEYALIELDSLNDVILLCDLLMNRDSFRVVMVDHQRRVRGYYDARTREETDRLILEMSIMLKKY